MGSWTWMWLQFSGELHSQVVEGYTFGANGILDALSFHTTNKPRPAKQLKPPTDTAKPKLRTFRQCRRFD
ncbi:hypothetical protein ACFX19_001668 [Malus domestica]